MPTDSNPATTTDTSVPRAHRFERRRRSAKNEIPSPQQLEAARQVTKYTVRHATIAMITSMLILLMFNSDGLRSYARDLPESDLADRIVLGADWWHGVMRRLGFTGPKARVREIIQKLREA